MRTPPWSSRNKLLWTPPGPEGSNGNDKFMCRDVAKVVLFPSHRIFRSSILREDWFVRSCEEMVFKDSPAVYIDSISYLGVQRHFLRCCAILSIPKYFPIIATSMMRMLFSDDEDAFQRHSSPLAEVSGYEIEAKWANQNATKESDIAHPGWAHDEAWLQE